MSGLRAAWRRWAELLATREDPLPLALVRVAYGLLVAMHLGHMLLAGVDVLAWVDRDQGGLRALNAWPFPQASPGLAQSVALATIGAALAMAAGVLTPLTVAATYAGFRWLGDLNSHAGGAYDEVMINTLFVLLFAGSGRALSLDAWWRRKKGQVTEDALAWPRWVLLGQAVVVYTSTGLQKVSASWLPVGERDALWYILGQPDWQRRAFSVPVWAYPLTQAATAFTWVWEVGAPVLLLALWWRRTRTRPGWLRAQSNRLDLRACFLFVGVLLHLGIESLLEVGAFSWAMLALYPCAWSGAEWRARLTRTSTPG